MRDHDAYRPGSKWVVLRPVTLTGRVWRDHGHWSERWGSWTKKVKAGETITCLGHLRQHEGVPAILWEGEDGAVDVVLEPSDGRHGSWMPRDGVLRRL